MQAEAAGGLNHEDTKKGFLSPIVPVPFFVCLVS